MISNSNLNRFVCSISLTLILFFNFIPFSATSIEGESFQIEDNIIGISNNLNSTTCKIFRQANEDPNISNIVMNSNDFKALQSNSGGYWLDTFKDDSQINLSCSHNLNISDDEVKIKGIKKKPLEVDNQTVALWHFDEGTGSMVFDATTNNNDGTFQYSPTWTTGQFDNGLNFSGGAQFSGSTDGINIPHSSSLDLTGNLTIEAWVKPDKSPASSYLCIVDKYYGSTSVSMGYTFYIVVGKLRFSIYSGSNGNKDGLGNMDLRDNKWHFVAATFNGTHISMYVDGKLDSATEWSYPPASTTNPLGIGKRLSGWGGYLPFDGVIDEIRISNIPRSHLEIWEHYAKRFEFYGNLTTKTIIKPANMYWDSLIIKGDKPINSEFNITILNGSNNNPISNELSYNTSGEYDISTIDPIKYPSVILNVTFDGDGTVSPKLLYWGISWVGLETWCDTFYGGLKIGAMSTMSNINVTDGDAKFEGSGELISKSIKVSNGYYYDHLIINCTTPISNPLKITILDAKNNAPIPGYIELISKSIELIGLNPKIYSEIKLIANFSTTIFENATIHDWSVNFTKNNKPRIIKIYTDPYRNCINRTESVKILVELFDKEETCREITVQARYRSSVNMQWRSDLLSDIYFNESNSLWEFEFKTEIESDLGSYDIWIFCNDSFQSSDMQIFEDIIEVLNNRPVILDITTNNAFPYLNRTKTLKVFVNVTDIEILSHQLDLNIEYKLPNSIDWQSNYISDVLFNNNRWEFQFTPTKDAVVGQYTIRITVNDTITEVDENLAIYVLNNIPSKPEVLILPINPKTTDELSVYVYKTRDVETPLNDLAFWYKWYRDGVHLEMFDNSTSIPQNMIKKNEVWCCKVRPFDGLNIGDENENSTFILNSPPNLVGDLEYVEIFEDTKLTLKNKLSNIFSDPDNDDLLFTSKGQNKIEITIFNENGSIIIEPEQNWFGTEYITFIAQDEPGSYAEINTMVVVKPTNDLPEIIKVGDHLITDPNTKFSYILNQDDWLNLSLEVEDIDGDVKSGLINFILNIEERSNFYFSDIERKLIFHPKNDDVGFYQLEISVTDNNETPLQYVSIGINIEVINVNDPPNVRITEPAYGAHFLTGQKITFSCFAEDIDLSILSSDEELKYQWTTNNSLFPVLGNNCSLNNVTLPFGIYNISVTVTDSSGSMATDFIIIEIEAPPKNSSKSEDTTYYTKSTYLMVIIFIIISIIICLIIFFLLKKRSEDLDARLAKLGIVVGKSYDSIQQTVDYPKLTTGTELSLSTSLGQGTISGTGLGTAATADVSEMASKPKPSLLMPKTVEGSRQLTEPGKIQPQAQLPPATLSNIDRTPDIVTTTSSEEQRMGITPSFSPSQKLKMLEELLIIGKISEKIFLKLKSKYELQTPQNKTIPIPIPKLPPAQKTTEQVKPETSIEPSDSE